MKKSNTKRALLMSALSLLLCVSMLVGTTFAWFTDTASTGVNTIQSGNLDIVLSYKNATQTTWKEVTATDKLFNDAALWEPGYTEVAYLKVENNGSLALKYELTVNVLNEVLGKNKAGGDIKLSQVLKYDLIELTGDTTYADRAAAMAAVSDPKSLVTEIVSGNMVAGADAKYYALVVYMPTTVGNEANHNGTNIPSIQLGVNVFATQMQSESDSFGNDYDGVDFWDGTRDAQGLSENTDTEQKILRIATAEQFAAFAESVNNGEAYAGYTVLLENDLDLNNLKWTPIGTSSKPFSGSFDGQGHTVSNLYIEKTVENIASSNRQGLFGTIKPSGATTFGNLKVHNVNVTGGYHVGGVIATSDGSNQSATGNYLVVTNIEMTGLIYVYGYEGVAGVMGSGNIAEISNITINAEPGSVVTTMPDGRTNSFACVGSVKGGGYMAKIDNITSNLNVTAKTAGTGGLFGVVGGQNVKCYVSNLSYSGTVTLTESSVDKTNNYSNYQYNGLLIGAPRFSLIADEATCSSTGTLQLHTEDGVIKTSNDMGETFTWGKDLFGASRDYVYTNKSYAKDYTS